MISLRPNKTEQKIIEALPKLPLWFTSTQVSETAIIPLSTTKTTLRLMVERGFIERGERVYISRNASSFLYSAPRLMPEIKEPKKPRNLFEAIIQYGHDEDWTPKGDHRFVGTGAAPGSEEKIEVLRRRVELGFPLWHKDDRVNYHGLVGAIVPK